MLLFMPGKWHRLAFLAPCCYKPLVGGVSLCPFINNLGGGKKLCVLFEKLYLKQSPSPWDTRALWSKISIKGRNSHNVSLLSHCYQWNLGFYLHKGPDCKALRSAPPSWVHYCGTLAAIKKQL